jgi:hypothetical protein
VVGALVGAAVVDVSAVVVVGATVESTTLISALVSNKLFKYKELKE